MRASDSSDGGAWDHRGWVDLEFLLLLDYQIASTIDVPVIALEVQPRQSIIILKRLRQRSRLFKGNLTVGNVHVYQIGIVLKYYVARNYYLMLV